MRGRRAPPQAPPLLLLLLLLACGLLASPAAARSPSVASTPAFLLPQLPLQPLVASPVELLSGHEAQQPVQLLGRQALTVGLSWAPAACSCAVCAAEQLAWMSCAGR
jgi:hypothetical protein